MRQIQTWVAALRTLVYSACALLSERTDSPEIGCHVIFMQLCVLLSSVQKVADDKGAKAKKGGAKGRKDDGPAQNGETKTNEV